MSTTDTGWTDWFDIGSSSDTWDANVLIDDPEIMSSIESDYFLSSDLGDTVGTASSLVNLLKTGLSTGADILGGGDAKGGAGFVSQKNPATQAALEAHMSRIYGRPAGQTTSPRGRGARNPHSDVIMRGFNQNAMASFSRILTASRSGGKRVYAKPREAL